MGTFKRARAVLLYTHLACMWPWVQVLVQDSAGGVAMLEHHVGRFLCAEPDGKVS